MPRRPDVPCAGCGRLISRSWSSRPPGSARCRECQRAEVMHGSVAMYEKRGCRCEPCRAAKAARMRTYAAAYKTRTGKVLWKQYRPDGSPSGGWIGHIRRIAIYERDGWTCGICAEPVDPADPNGDLAPSLDHILPQILGGTDDDDNLRCAHRVCNSRRGAPALV